MKVIEHVFCWESIMHDEMGVSQRKERGYDSDIMAFEGDCVNRAFLLIESSERPESREYLLGYVK